MGSNLSRRFSPSVGRRIAGMDERNTKRTFDSWLQRRQLVLEDGRRWTLRDVVRAAVWGEIHRLRLPPAAFPATVAELEFAVWSAFSDVSVLDKWANEGRFVVLSAPTQADLMTAGTLPAKGLTPFFKSSNPLTPEVLTRQELIGKLAAVERQSIESTTASRIVIDLHALAARLVNEVFYAGGEE